MGGFNEAIRKFALIDILKYNFQSNVNGCGMQKEIHPTYFERTLVKCACGFELTVGSTVEKINVDVCSNCHPFYTGQDRILDTEGRVEKFKKKFNL